MTQREKPQNLLQFNGKDIQQLELSLNTKAQSLTFGRLIYTFQKGDQQFWLKTQRKNGNQKYQAGFLNEIAFYQQSVDRNQRIHFLLPFQIITDLAKIEAQEVLNTALLLSNAETFLRSSSSLSIDRIKATLFKMLDAVEQMHDLGWIHGDLKAEHFLHYQQRVCLIDFEYVQPIAATEHCRNLIATPRYMAPELFHGQPKTVQSDLYALGIIFYEWLTGQRLSAKNYNEWAYLHCQHLRIELPQRFYIFKQLIQKMLAKQTDHRAKNIFQLKHCLLTENV
jgi:serine/threonine protein kinase